ncbi:Fanconi anemia, complementation group I isoform X1 [Bombyx mori]|uniref:Fanconi anemia, complementation group I isoform X1 n=1 Tax=Bombyx mori TaxID=7091 RepID=UPI002ED69A64
MDSSFLFAKLKELGPVNSEKDNLIEHCTQNIQQIIKFLSRRLLASDGGQILDYLFNGLTESLKIHKIKIVDVILQTMRKEPSSLTHCADIISRLCLELPQLPANDLVRWCNDSIQSVVEDTDVNMIWRDIVPECISSLQNYDTIQHYDTEMSSDDYKTQCVHTLCQFQWKEEHLVQLAAMFTDMQLSRVDHTQVVNKMCSLIIKVAPENLPPLTLQLMRLCKLYNLDIVLSHLSHYFNASLFGKLEPPPQDSESTTMDVDDIVSYTIAEFSQCLSNCIFHISQGPVDPELVRKHLKMWPKTQLLRSPFMVNLALVMSDKGTDYRTVCLNVIKSAIEQRVLDDIMRKKSAWERSVMLPDVDVASLLKVLTTDSASQLSVGLMNLAFALLSVSPIKPVAHACWSHGKLILVRLCKAQRETVPYVLNNLGDRLAGHNAQKQYADCLYVLCKLTPASVEGRSELSTILENCQPSGGDYGLSAAVLDSVRPLINFSTRTRDTLVMVCRKGLYSRDSCHRCLALSGFLTVLRHVRLSRALSSSQAESSEQYSANSYLTQIAVDFHASQQGTAVSSRVRNEAVCMEVVSILRRCLMQDALVKELLYTKIYDCSQEKIALHELIMELLYEHLSKYLTDNNSLMLDKCVQIGATNATLLEPISNLLYVICQFLQPELEEDYEDILASNTESGSTFLKNKLNLIMEGLCASNDLGQICVEDPGLSDLTPESKAKCLKVQQTLQIYETLIAYQIMQWRPDSTEAAGTVYRLYKECDQLLEKTKGPSKLAKKRRKSLNETKDSTVKSQKSPKSQKGKSKSPKKLSNMVKDRGSAFKQLPCLWDLKLCVRIAGLLYAEHVPWTSSDQRNQLRARRDFHVWTLRCIVSVLSKNNLEKHHVATHVVSLCRLMYSRCICRFSEMCEFDDQTTVNCIEVFRLCLSLLFSNNYSFKLDFFLPKITDQTETVPSACMALILEKILASLTLMEEEAFAEGNESKKLIIGLVNTASLLLEQPVQSTPEMTSVIVKFEDFMRKTYHDCLSMLPALLAAGCREHQETLFLEDLLAKLTESLGKIDEEDTSRNESCTLFGSVTDVTVHSVLNYLCVHLSDRMQCAEHLLHRARDLSAAVPRATPTARLRIERELNEIYESTVVHMCQLTTWTSRVVSLRCSVGPSSSRVLGTCTRLYTLLATLAKQISVAIAKNARFDRLLKLSGKRLSTIKDNFITYLGSSQELVSARRVERDTKLIPRLVHEAEQYAKHVILLADKAQLNWQQYLSLGTSRDFRINGQILQQVLHDADGDDADRTNEDIHDASTVVTQEDSGDEDNQEELEEEGEPENSDEGTPEKKRKRI